MKYLAVIRRLPDKQTGAMKVAVPTLSGNEERVAYPKTLFLGLLQPYQLGDIIVVEIVENVLYYGDRLYANDEYPVENVPPDSYSFVTPFGYISFTKDSVEIAHRLGGKVVITDSVTHSNAPSPQDLKFTKWK
jgi:hypothetical protein